MPATAASVFAAHAHTAGEVELMGSWTKPRGIGIDTEPYSAPANLYLYWGSTVNKRFTGVLPTRPPHAALLCTRLPSSLPR